MTNKETEEIFNSIPEFLKSLSKKERKQIFDFIDFINHPVREKIIRLCIEKPRTISELQKEINIGYKSVWEHVRKLETKGVLKTEKKIDKVGKIVLVSYNGNVILKDGSRDIDWKIRKNFFLSKKNL